MAVQCKSNTWDDMCRIHFGMYMDCNNPGVTYKRENNTSCIRIFNELLYGVFCNGHGNCDRWVIYNYVGNECPNE